MHPRISECDPFDAHLLRGSRVLTDNSSVRVYFVKDKLTLDDLLVMSTLFEAFSNSSSRAPTALTASKY